MQITLNQDEINDAIEAYVRSQINIADNQSVDIEFNSGRAPNGPTATLNIKTRAAAMSNKPTSIKPVTRSISSTPEDRVAPEEEPAVETQAETSSEGDTSGAENTEAVSETAGEEAPEPSVTPKKSIFSKAS